MGGVFALLTTKPTTHGLPVMGALVPHVQMCYVLNAMRDGHPRRSSCSSASVARRGRGGVEAAAADEGLVLSVLRGQTKNFLNIAVVSGLLWNLLLGGGRGCPLPFFLESLFVTMGGAFGPIVLFLGGARNVGAFAQLSALTSILMPLLTVLLKVLVLPTFVANVAGWLGGTRATVDFAFAFSTLPSAASTLVFAAPYKPSEDMASLMNASLLLHKVGFRLFLAAATATTTDAHEIVEIERVVALDTQRSARSPPSSSSSRGCGRWLGAAAAHTSTPSPHGPCLPRRVDPRHVLLDATLGAHARRHAFALPTSLRGGRRRHPRRRRLSLGRRRARLAAARQRASTRNSRSRRARARSPSR